MARATPEMMHLLERDAEERTKTVSVQRQHEFAVADAQAATLLRKLAAEVDPEHTQRGHYHGAGHLLYWAAIYLDNRRWYEATVLSEGAKIDTHRKRRDRDMGIEEA
jgi:hypothetical protein